MSKAPAASTSSYSSNTNTTTNTGVRGAALGGYAPGTQGQPDILTTPNKAVTDAMTEHANAIGAKYDTIVKQMQEKNDALQRSYDNMKNTFDQKTQNLYDQLQRQENEYRESTNRLNQQVSEYHDNMERNLSTAAAGEKARLSSNAQERGFNSNTALEAAQIANEKYGQQLLSNQQTRLQTLQNLQRDYQSFLQNNFSNKQTLSRDEADFANKMIDKMKALKDEELALQKEIRSQAYDPMLDQTKAGINSTMSQRRYQQASEERQNSYSAIQDPNQKKQFLLDTLKSFYQIDVSGVNPEALEEAIRRPSFADAIAYLANADKRLNQQLLERQQQMREQQGQPRVITRYVNQSNTNNNQQQPTPTTTEDPKKTEEEEENLDNSKGIPFKRATPGFLGLNRGK